MAVDCGSDVEIAERVSTPASTGAQQELAAPETTPESEPNPERRKRSWAKKVALRRLHPKLYLKFLCDPTDTKSRAYVETDGGCRALGTLDWRAVHAVAEHLQFARSMFEDLALGLGVAHPFPGTSHPVTGNLLAAAVLRNL